MNVHRAQWKIARRDIEKSLMKDGKAADVLKGDWESYVAPVFKQQATLEDKKSAHGVPVDAKEEALTRATRALAINQAIKLQGKLKVAEKIGSML